MINLKNLNTQMTTKGAANQKAVLESIKESAQCNYEHLLLREMFESWKRLDSKSIYSRYHKELAKMGLTPWSSDNIVDFIRNKPDFVAGNIYLINKWGVTIAQLKYARENFVKVSHLVSAAKIWNEAISQNEDIPFDSLKFHELSIKEAWNPDTFSVLKLRGVCKSDTQFGKVLRIILRATNRPSVMKRQDTYICGTHYAELFCHIIPTKKILSKGIPSVKRWIAFILNTGMKGRRVNGQDAIRASHLSPIWQRTAVSYLRNKKIDWEMLSEWMKNGVPNDIKSIKEADESCLLPADIKMFLWKKHYNRAPKNRALFRIDTDLVVMLKPNFKFLMRLIKNVDIDLHTATAAAKLAIVFGKDAKTIVDAVGNLHDAGINLTPPYSKEIVKFLFKNRDRFISAVKLANNMLGIIHAGGNFETMSFKELEKISRSIKYDNVRIPDLAIECAAHSISQDWFEKTQEVCLEKELPVYETVPSVYTTDGAYRMYRLDKSDYRALFMGFYTDCCQHVARGAGASCAWHSMYDENGAVYVVEYNGRIIAQSWTWRYGDTIVFDNVEVLGSSYSMETIKSLYKEVSEKMLDSLCVNRVHVGTGYDDVGLEEFKRTEAVSTPSGCYSDAYNQKLIIAKEVV